MCSTGLGTVDLIAEVSRSALRVVGFRVEG